MLPRRPLSADAALCSRYVLDALPKPLNGGIGQVSCSSIGLRPALLATWGGIPSHPIAAESYGYSDADRKEIQDAADRANRSKGRRR